MASNDDEILDKFQKGIQLNLQLSQLVQSHLKNKAEEEKLRRFAVQEVRESLLSIQTQNSQLKKELEKVNYELSVWKDRERSSNFHSERLIDQNNQLVQQIRCLKDELCKQQNAHEKEIASYRTYIDELQAKINKFGEDENQRHETELQMLQDKRQLGEKSADINEKPTEDNGNCVQPNQFSPDLRFPRKFIFANNHSKTIPEYLSKDNVKYINYCRNNFGNIAHDITTFHRELLIVTWWEYINPLISKDPTNYRKLLSICQHWKQLRPDAEIHCLYFYFFKKDSFYEPSKELQALFTTCNAYLSQDESSDVSAIRHYWSRFADKILSDQSCI